MKMHFKRWLFAMAAALGIAVGSVAVASPAAAEPTPEIAGAVVVAGVDVSQLDMGRFVRRGEHSDFPSGKVYCTSGWHPTGCLEPLEGFVRVCKKCGRDGSNVDIYIFNPNQRPAPRDLYHLNSRTGTGFGDTSFSPPGWSVFPIRNIPPGMYDFLVRWDDQELTFLSRERVVLTCPSPPPPTYPAPSS